MVSFIFGLYNSGHFKSGDLSMGKNDSNSYEIYIDYNKEEASHIVFKQVSDFLKTIDSLNNAISTSFGKDIETNAIIEDLASGSVRIWLKDKINSLSDQRIDQYSQNPKLLIADVLKIIKHGILKLLEDKNEENINEKAIQIVYDVINDSEVKSIGYKIDKVKILQATSDLVEISNKMYTPPKVIFDKEQPIVISSNYNFNIEDFEEIKKKTINYRSTFIIKKPDMVGDSKWTLIADKSIEVKILDIEWMQKLKNREFPISCGDSLDADIKVETFYNENNFEVIESRYFITKVHNLEEPKIKKDNKMALL